MKFLSKKRDESAQRQMKSQREAGKGKKGKKKKICLFFYAPSFVTQIVF